MGKIPGAVQEDALAVLGGFAGLRATEGFILFSVE